LALVEHTLKNIWTGIVTEWLRQTGITSARTNIVESYPTPC